MGESGVVVDLNELINSRIAIPETFTLATACTGPPQAELADDQVTCEWAGDGGQRRRRVVGTDRVRRVGSDCRPYC